MFDHGWQARLAEAAGVSRTYLNDCLRGRKRATPENAAAIEAAAEQMGITLTRMDLMYPQESRNPLIKVAQKGRD